MLIGRKIVQTALKKHAVKLAELLRTVDDIRVLDEQIPRKGSNDSSYYVDIAEVERGTHIEVWLDRCDNEKFRYWIGIAGSKSSINKFIARLPNSLQPKGRPLTLRDYVLKRNKGEKYHVYRNMKSGDLAKPFVEFIRQDEGYFGIYLFGDQAPDGLPSFDSYKAALFLKQLVVEAQDVNQEEWKPREGWIKERLVKSRHREAKKREEKILSVLKKPGARLRCEVPNCGFDFQRVYGVLGQRYAHVHHKTALANAKGRGRQTSLSDLAIVCANCHAMIHRYGECRKMTGLIVNRSRRSVKDH